MPNWIVHLGINGVIAKSTRIRNLKLFLLGALLPDIARITQILSDSGIKLDYVSLYAYFETLHTPFMLLLLSLLIALFNENMLKSFILVYCGAIIHLIADYFEISLGTGIMWFYPISTTQFEFGLFQSDGVFEIILTGLSFVFLMYLIIHYPRKKTKLRFKSIKWACLTLVVILIVPYLTLSKVRNGNNYVNFFANQKKWEEKNVIFNFSKVVKEKPLIIEEMGMEYNVASPVKLKKGEWVSFIGKYKNNKILIDYVYLHKGRIKSWFSILGMVMFLYIWFV